MHLASNHAYRNDVKYKNGRLSTYRRNDIYARAKVRNIMEDVFVKIFSISSAEGVKVKKGTMQR